MKRGNKLLLLLLGLAVAVGAWVLVTKLMPDEEEAEASAAPLVSMSADDIVSLSWTQRHDDQPGAAGNGW